VNVKFTYPTRHKPVFENLNLTIEAGKKVALVGSSGCGNF
jgi:ABC-type transport system involved in cytochrome bd biosynthesis fused ATPase/permease subunit